MYLTQPERQIEPARLSLRFRWVKTPTSAELTQLTHTIARPAIAENRLSLTHQGTVRMN